MSSVINQLLIDALAALYQAVGFSLLLSFFFMYFYLYSNDSTEIGMGWKNSVLKWIRSFKCSKEFRCVFYFVFYTVMILFRTLLNRTPWKNPLSNVFGNWRLYYVDAAEGTVTVMAEGIENFILFIPFTMLFLNLKPNKHNSVCSGAIIGFTFSIIIEFIQLFFYLGTFQLSDIFYNTLGACIGGILYCLIGAIKKNIKR